MDEDDIQIEVTFLAPNGAAISGCAQYDVASWPVYWNNPDYPSSFDDYIDGPGGAEWETLQLRQGPSEQHELVWVDEGGEEWLSRHLIREGFSPLPDDLVALMRLDLNVAKALHYADLALAELGDQTSEPLDPLNPIRHDAREVRGDLIRRTSALAAEVHARRKAALEAQNG